MAFILRSVQQKDIRDLQVLATQFTLINLPNDLKALEKKVDISERSFADKIKDSGEREYLFVVEDQEEERVVGSSLILAKHGTPNHPHYYFKVSKKEHFSSDLGIGFMHQVLKLEEETDGPTEIGGLLVDTNYRRISEKIGRQISLVRFLFMGMNLEKIQDKLLCELSPPQMAVGKSEFWESLGRRFTGLNYKEADQMSYQHKEFISSLFPKEEIYTCILSSTARFVLGRVGDETRPAQHLLEKLGFRYLNEVDPFDGGPHFGAVTKEVPLVKNTKHYEVASTAITEFKEFGLVGYVRDGQFTAYQTAYHTEGNNVTLPETTLRIVKLDRGQKVSITSMI